MKSLKISSIFIIILFLSSCASIEGTRNKSYTYKNNGPIRTIEKLAILPIQESSNYPFLPELIEDKIANQIKLNYPSTEIILSAEVSHLLASKNRLDSYTSWYSSYIATKYLEFDKLDSVVSDLNISHILSVRSVSVEREKIRGVDAGYSGMVSDAKNVLRTNLKFIGELIDIKNRKIAYQGIGYSENINSPRKDLDLFLVIQHQKSPEVAEFLNEMVSVAAAGFVNEMSK